MSIDWDKILAAEDKIIENSDRKHRYHFASLETISDRIIFKESMTQYQQDDSEELKDIDFLQSLKSEKLRCAFEKLTSKQSQALELYYWQGYNHREIAEIMGIKRNTVSELITRAVSKLIANMVQ